ncbi:MAG: hypothetical protein JW788_00735 [Candidatus Omnitrophica bacterium]|nr:hypothetical protein [Candidatus Omnitrophota bacterium]
MGEVRADTAKATDRGRCGVSLLEIAIALLIIGIMLVIFPNQRKSIERHKGKEAEMSLIAIYNAEKRYKLENARYYACDFNCSVNGTNMIEKELSLVLNEKNFDYTINSDGASGYLALATRKGGDYCDGMSMMVNESSSNVIKGCEAW